MTGIFLLKCEDFWPCHHMVGGYNFILYLEQFSTFQDQIYAFLMYFDVI